MILPGHVTTDNFGNQKPQHPPSLLKIHQLIWKAGEVQDKCFLYSCTRTIYWKQ